MKIKFILPILVSFMFSASALAHDGNYCVTIVNNSKSILQFAQLTSNINVNDSANGSSLVGTGLMPGQQSVYTYLLTTSGHHSTTGFVLGWQSGYAAPFPSTPFLVLDLDNGITIDSTATSGGVYNYSVTPNASSSCQGNQTDGGYNVIVSPLAN